MRPERAPGAGVSARAAMAVVGAIALALGAGAAGAAGTEGPAVARLKAGEVARPGGDPDEALLGRALALALDGADLYVADAQDCAIKVFSKAGRFLRSFGRRGRGPGELTFPSGVAVAGDRVFVADKLNARIQAFERDGRPAGGFPVRFLPDRIHALAADSLLVTGNPTGKRRGEALLHIFDAAGRLRWKGLEASFSGDPTYDAFRNMILVCPAGKGDFFVVFRSGERTVLRFDATGAALGRIAVDERHRSLPLEMPFKGGEKRLLGFCWAAACDGGLLYLSGPAPVDGRDLGPGREISVVDEAGRLRSVIELGRAVHRFVVERDRIFAVDEEGELRIFEVGR
jgi:hypothetical protein